MRHILSLSFLCFVSFCAFCQCTYRIYYSKGKFRLLASGQFYPGEFTGFNGLTWDMISKNSSLAPDTVKGEKKEGYTLMSYECNSYVFTLCDGVKWAVFRQDSGQLTPFKYDLAIPWAPANDNSIGWDSCFALVSLKGKWGLVNKTGKEATKIVYDLPYVEKTAAGTFYYYLPDNKQPGCDVKSGNCPGYFLQDGLFQLPVLGPSLLLLRNGKFGGIDLNGNETIPFDYEEIITSRNSLHQAMRSGKWGYMDDTGQEIIPCKYEYCSEFKDEEVINTSNNKIVKIKTAIVKYKGKIITIDESGNTVEEEE